MYVSPVRWLQADDKQYYGAVYSGIPLELILPQKYL